MKKTDRKLHKKQVKALNIVKKDYLINSCEEATRNLLVCNAGLMTGTSREDLLQALEKYGKVENIIMMPRKSYSFVVMNCVEDSKRVMEELNGNMFLDSNAPIFFLFIDQVPEIEDPWGTATPPGLQVLPDFVSAEEENCLLGIFSAMFENEEGSGGDLKNRRVKHFGFEFDYSTNNIDANKPISSRIPDKCHDLMERMVSMGLIPHVGDQLTANLYSPGQGIPPHTDSHSCCTDWLCSLSLGSSILMELKDPQEEICPVWLPSRSLLVLREEARYCWKHGITPRHSDIIPSCLTGKRDAEQPRGNELTLHKRETRLSLTFRKSLKGECECKFRNFCDRKRSTVLDDLSESLTLNAATVESRMVHQVYEEIAAHFSETRHKPWPRVVDFVMSLPYGGVLLDVGCGNGKYLGVRDGLVEIGSDFSHNLLKIVRDRGFQGVRSDMLYLGFKDGIACGIICIAVLHHLSTPDRRIFAIQEMTRVLEKGGRLLIYVWAKDQKKEEMSSYLKQNKKNFKSKSAPESSLQLGEFGLPVHKNRTDFQYQDLLVPWKLKSSDVSVEEKTFNRYYHVFQEGELEDLISAAGNLIVTESYYDQGNWCCVCKKM